MPRKSCRCKKTGRYMSCRKSAKGRKSTKSTKRGSARRGEANKGCLNAFAQQEKCTYPDNWDAIGGDLLDKDGVFCKVAIPMKLQKELKFPGSLYPEELVPKMLKKNYGCLKKIVEDKCKGITNDKELIKCQVKTAIQHGSPFKDSEGLGFDGLTFHREICDPDNYDSD